MSSPRLRTSQDEAGQVEMKATVNANQENMEATVKTGQEEIKATVATSQEKLETSQGKMEAKQEKTEIVSQHCKWVSHIKAMHLLTALEGQLLLSGISSPPDMAEVLMML